MRPRQIVLPYLDLISCQKQPQGRLPTLDSSEVLCNLKGAGHEIQCDIWPWTWATLSHFLVKKKKKKLSVLSQQRKRNRWDHMMYFFFFYFMSPVRPLIIVTSPRLVCYPQRRSIATLNCFPSFYWGWSTIKAFFLTGAKNPELSQEAASQRADCAVFMQLFQITKLGYTARVHKTGTYFAWTLKSESCSCCSK